MEPATDLERAKQQVRALICPRCRIEHGNVLPPHVSCEGKCDIFNALGAAEHVLKLRDPMLCRPEQSSVQAIAEARDFGRRHRRKTRRFSPIDRFAGDLVPLVARLMRRG